MKRTQIKKAPFRWAVYWSFFPLIVLMAFISSCNRFLDIDVPQTQLSSASVFLTDNNATAATVGLYAKMMSYGNSFGQHATAFMGLSADELISIGENDFYNNQLTPTSASEFIWRDYYQLIYNCNAIIGGLDQSEKVSTGLKRQLKGEALVVRSLFHFYLLNLFGDIPYVINTDYSSNNQVKRMPMAQVYEKLIADLNEAKILLADAYPTAGKVRPNKATAQALLARVYLYHQDWEKAEREATEVINSPAGYDLSPINEVFLANSKEAIWQLMPVEPGYNTWEGFNFILKTEPNTQVLSELFVAAFNPADKRLANWVGKYTGTRDWYFPFKYHVAVGSIFTEYYTVLRLGEQYLIRAEARAQLDRLARNNSSASDLNRIRLRAGLGDTEAITKEGLLLAIAQERRFELFCEQGHRWFDLKRTNGADAVLAPLKAPNWQSTDVLYPIPKSELQKNRNLTQNPGY